MSRVYLFKKGEYFHIQYKDYRGRSCQKTTKTKNKAEAERFLDVFSKKDYNNPTELPFSKVAGDILDLLSTHIAPKTIRSYKQSVDQFIAHMDDRSISVFPQSYIELYKAKALKHLQPSSVNITLRSLKAICNYGIKWGFISNNPFKGVSLIRIPEKLPSYIIKEDFIRLLSVIDIEIFKQIFLVTAFTGMRLREVINLQWSDIKFETGLILLTNKEGFLTKNRKSRVIPLNHQIHSLLLLRKGAQEQSSYVFSLSGKRMSGSYLSHRFKRYIRLAGLPEELHFHCLRSSFASWLVMSNVDIYAVSKLLGHSDVSITTKHYAHLRPEQLHSEVNKISLPGITL